MTRKRRYIEKLTKGQKSSLEKGHKTGNRHSFRRKCQSILLSYNHKTVEDISQLNGVTRRTVYSWFNAWESQGIKGLELKPGQGRKPKLKEDNPHQVKVVKVLIENEPKNLNRVIVQIKSNLGINLSKKTLKRFLKNLNIAGSDSVNG
jgi:transposase